MITIPGVDSIIIILGFALARTSIFTLALAATGGCGVCRIGAEGCMQCDPSISIGFVKSIAA